MAAERRRLSGLDTAFLFLERDITPMQLGSLAIFRSDRPVRPADVVSVLTGRADRIPRLGRRVQPAWFPPGSARWADDPHFRAGNHVFLHHLRAGEPAAGDGVARAAELGSELMARPLRRDRPLWELHVMTGLDEHRFAVLTKLHHALGDGLAALEIGIGLLDGFAAPASPAGAPAATATAAAGNGRRSAPGRGGSRRSRISAARRILARPLHVAGDVRAAAGGAVGQAADTLGMTASVLRSARLPAPGSPLVVTSSGRRGLGIVRLDLRQVRRVRAHFGGTVNDVLLAVVAGALRQWCIGQDRPVDGMSLRALVPVSRRARSGDRAGGNELSGYLCELPVGEPDPGRRLRAVQDAMRRSKAAGLTRGPGAIPLLADRLPAALHRVVAPVAGQVAALLFDILVTSVPMPGVALRLDGAELEEIYPVAPLAPGHALGVALSCYRGTAYIGMHADRQAVPDVRALADAVTASARLLDEVCA